MPPITKKRNYNTLTALQICDQSKCEKTKQQYYRTIQHIKDWLPTYADAVKSNTGKEVNVLYDQETIVPPAENDAGSAPTIITTKEIIVPMHESAILNYMKDYSVNDVGGYKSYSSVNSVRNAIVFLHNLDNKVSYYFNM